MCISLKKSLADFVTQITTGLRKHLVCIKVRSTMMNLEIARVLYEEGVLISYCYPYQDRYGKQSQDSNLLI